MTEEKYLTENRNMTENITEVKRKPVSFERQEKNCRKPIPLEKRMFDEQSDDRINNYFPGKQKYYAEQRQREYLAKTETENTDCVKQETESEITEFKDVNVNFNKVTPTLSWLSLIGLVLFFVQFILSFLLLLVSGTIILKFTLCFLLVLILLILAANKTEEYFTTKYVKAVIKCENSIAKVIPEGKESSKEIEFKGSNKSESGLIVLHSRKNCGIGCVHVNVNVSTEKQEKLLEYLRNNNIE